MRFGYRRQHCLQTFFVIQRVKQLKNLLLQEPMRFWLKVINRWHHCDGNWIGVRYSLFSTSSFPFWIFYRYNCAFFFYNRRQDEDFKATDQCPDFLSPEQHQFLSGKPSMKGFTERLSTMKQETVTQVWQTYIVRFQRICFDPEIGLFTDTAAN